MTFTKRIFWLVPMLVIGAGVPAPVTGMATRSPTLGINLASKKHMGERPVWNRGLTGIRHKIIYQVVQGQRLTLFLFKKPSVSLGRRPVVVYIHGGGLRFGTAMITNAPTPHNRLLVRLEREVIKEHMDFVSLNYRLAPLYPWPEPLHDVKRAIKYLKAHSRYLGINPGRIDVMGDSAGGELATFVGLTMQNPHGQPAVQGVVDLFGPVDREGFARRWRDRHGLTPNPVYGIYTPRRARRESAIVHVHPGAPPFLIVQGEKDRVVPPYQSLMLQERLSAVGVPVTQVMVKNAGHELIARGGAIDPPIPWIASRINRFLKGTLGRRLEPPLQGRDSGGSE